MIVPNLIGKSMSVCDRDAQLKRDEHAHLHRRRHGRARVGGLHEGIVPDGRPLKLDGRSWKLDGRSWKIGGRPWKVGGRPWKVSGRPS